MSLAEFDTSDQIRIYNEALKREYLSSLYNTCKHLLGYSDMQLHVHKKMCDALEAPTKRKMIVYPRGTFKSSVGAVGYSIWSLLNNPNLRILIDSEVYGNSKNFIREIRGHLSSPKIIELFGEFKTDHNWGEGEITIAQRTKVLKEASITAGGIGTAKTGQHYDIIIGDDYNSANNSETSDGRDKVINHYRMNQAILDPGGIYVIIGTRYSVSDILGFILENEINHKGLLYT